MKRHAVRSPRLSIDDLLERAREHRPRGQGLTDLLNRRRNVNAEADAEIDLLKADPSPSGRAYKLLGAAQHRADAKRIAIEKLRLIEPHLARALFEARHQHGELAQALDAFEAAERQPPSMEDAILALTGEPGWSLDHLLLGSLLEQVTLANVRAELRAASPSRRADLYERASVAPFDPVNSVMIRVLETERIPYADAGTSPEEATAAARLGRLIDEAQTARVPDTAAVRAVLEDVGRALRTAELSGIVPVNPDHPGVAHPEPMPVAAGG
jgi:hypothetical protein